MFKKVIVIGAGGHGRVVADAAIEAGYECLGFLDDAASGKAFGLDVLGNVDCASEYEEQASFIVAIGDNVARERVVQKINRLCKKAEYATVIHPSAVISKSASVGCGTVIMAGAVVNSGARIGEHCIINTAAVVEHDCRLENYVHISPRAALSGTVSVGERTHIGTGASVRNNLSIASDCTVGVGAAVVKNIEISGVYCGVPARKLK